MIIRLVKLTFHHSNVDEFISLFESSKENIQNFHGCNELKLYRDKNNLNIFFTYSVWESETDLDSYRSSELFKSIWKKTKTLFMSDAEAWSLTSDYTDF